MGFIGSMLGAGKGSDFQAAGNPTIAPSPVNQGQIDASYTGAQNSMEAQQALLSALQNQNGLSGQSQALSQLQTIGSGGGPNPAQAQYRENVNQLAAQQAGLMGSQKGISPALSARLIAQQGAQAQQNAAGQGAANAANQQLSAINAAGQLSTNMAANQIGQTNANTASQQGEQQALLGAQTAYGAQQAGILGNVNSTNSATQIQNSKAQQGIFGGLLGGAGGILSDENVKTDIKPADDKIQDFLDKVGAHEYAYKQSVQGHPGAAPGQHTGPMAQELEKSELGRQMVVDTPDGKGVDFGRGLGTIVAAQAALNKRLEALEGGGRKMADGGMVTQAPPQPLPMAPPNAPFANPFSPPAPTGPQSKFGQFLSGMAPQNQNEQGGGGGMGGEDPIKSGMDKLIKSGFDKLNGNQTPSSGGAPVGGLPGNKPAVVMNQNPRGLTAPGHTWTPENPNVPTPHQLTAPGNSWTPENPNVPTYGAADSAEGIEGADAAASGAEATEGASAAESAGTAAEAAEGADSATELVAALAKGGKVKKNSVDALVSPGELRIPKEEVGKVARGKNPFASGEKIPGKPKVAGNSYSNDTVPKKLKVGDVIIPNSIMQSANPAKGAKDFVAKIIAKRKAKG